MAGGVGREVEAKFIVKSPSVLRPLCGLRRLGSFRRLSSRRERQRNTYWDTAGLRMRRGKAALKVRQVGGRRELSFKREIRRRGGVSERIELTAPMKGAARRLPETEPLRRARKMAGSRDLQPVLTLLTDRRRQLLGRGKERIEVDIDRVTVRKPGAGLGGHTEIELENVSASPEAFREALAEFRRRFGKSVAPSRFSKYELGLRRLRRRS